jgi:hypothetical protein
VLDALHERPGAATARWADSRTRAGTAHRGAPLTRARTTGVVEQRGATNVGLERRTSCGGMTCGESCQQPGRVVGCDHWPFRRSCCRSAAVKMAKAIVRSQ